MPIQTLFCSLQLLLLFPIAFQHNDTDQTHYINNEYSNEFPELANASNFDITAQLKQSSTLYYLLACLFVMFLSKFVFAFVPKSTTTLFIITQMFMFFIPSVTAITMSYLAYSTPSSTYRGAYGTTSDGTVYLIGGVNYPTTVIRWQPNVDASVFTQIASTETGLGITVQCRTKCAEVIQGYDGHEYLYIISSTNSLYPLIFNVTSETFVDNNISAVAGYRGCVTTDGSNNIYYSGSETGDYNHMAVLDTSTSITNAQWTSLTNLTLGRMRHACFYLDGVHYDFGGIDTDSNKLDDAWKYSVSSNNWTQISYTFPDAISLSKAIYSKSQRVAFIFGGVSTAGVEDMSFIFDPTTDTMTEEYNLNFGRYYAATSIVDNVVYVISGLPTTSTIEYSDLTTFAPTTEPTTYHPTTDPTSMPTSEPTMEPTYDPTNDPTTDPTYDPTNDPTYDPTTDPTNDPTTDPTTDPSKDPTQIPTYEPTVDPTQEPTYDPTSDPTNDPTFDPTQPTNDPTTDPTSEPTYDPTSMPTFEPSYDPTLEPSLPTLDPTSYPSKEPTSTPSIDSDDGSELSISDVQWTFPEYNGFVIVDPFIKLTFTVEITVYDLNKEFCSNANCYFWYLFDYNNTNGTWIDISEHPSVTEINLQLSESSNNDDTYSISLVITRIRTLNNGYCYNVNDIHSHIFEQGHSYGIKMNVNDSDNDISEESDVRDITINHLASNYSNNNIAECHISNVTELSDIFGDYHLLCSNWIDPDSWSVNLSYNAIIENILFSEDNVYNLSELDGVIGMGNTTITILIYDQYDVPYCYDLQQTWYDTALYLLDVNNSNTEEEVIDDLIEQIDALIENTIFADSPQTAVAIYSVVIDLYFGNYSENAEMIEIVADMVVNVMEIDDGIDTANEITTVIALLGILTSETELFEENTTLNVIDFITDILDLIEDYSDTSSESEYFVTTEQALYIMAESVETLIVNLEDSLDLRYSDIDNDDTFSEMVELLNDYSTLSAALSLVSSDVGSTYTYVSYSNNNTKIVYCEKVLFTNVSDPVKFIFYGSGLSSEAVSIPKPFRENNYGIYYVATASNSRNLFYKEIDYKSQSNLITVNIYENADNSNQTLDEIPSTNEYTDRCSPYLIRFSDVNDSVTNDAIYDDGFDWKSNRTIPKCNYWNTTNLEWNNNGCFFYKNISDNNSDVICACIHLTTFSISEKDFAIEINVLTLWDFENITMQNMIKYPTVWVVILCLFSVILSVCIARKYWRDDFGDQNKSIIAFEDIASKKIRDEKMENDMAKHEILYLNKWLPNLQYYGKGLVVMSKSEKKSICILQLNLFRLYFRNDHVLWSVFRRTSGTNYSTRQRMGVFFMYLCSVMAASAIFYGVQQSSDIGDVTASFLMSLFATIPTFVIKKLFVKSKPAIVEGQLKFAIKSSELHSGQTVPIQGDDNDNDNDDDGMKSQQVKPAAPVRNTSVLELTTKGNNNGEHDDNTEISKSQVTQKGEHDDDDEGGPSMLHKVRMTKTVRNILALIKQDGMKSSIKTLNDALKRAQQSQNTAQQYKVFHEVREILFGIVYPLPSRTKGVTWIVLFLWCFGCIILAIVYGLQFDLEYTETVDLDDCWSNEKEIEISFDMSSQRADHKQESLKSDNSDSYNQSESYSWLLSLVQSIALSLLLWQPLAQYMQAWVKLWMFTWNLRMDIGPGNCVALFGKCCCCGDGDEDDHDNDESNGGIVSYHGRPLDIIGFLSNDILFLDENEDYGHDDGNDDNGDGDDGTIDVDGNNDDDDDDGDDDDDNRTLEHLLEQEIKSDTEKNESEGRDSANLNSENTELIELELQPIKK